MTRTRLYSATLSLFLTASAFAGALNPEIRFTSAAIVCQSCAKKVVKVLRKDPRVKDARVDVDQHQVTIALKTGQQLSDSELKELVAPTGFSIDSIDR